MRPLVTRLAESAAHARRSAVTIVAALTAAFAFAVLAQPARGTAKQYPEWYMGIVTYVQHGSGLNTGIVTESAVVTFSDPVSDSSGVHYYHAAGSWTVSVQTRFDFGDGTSCSWDGSGTSAISMGGLTIPITWDVSKRFDTGDMSYSFIWQPPQLITQTCTSDRILWAPLTLQNWFDGGGFSTVVGAHVHGETWRPGPLDDLGWSLGTVGVETWDFTASSLTTETPVPVETNGTANLPVKVPGPGKLGLSGKYVVKQSKSVAAQGTVKLLVRAKGKAKKTLDKKGKVNVTVKITFTPTGGTPASQTKTVRLIEKG